MDSGERIRTPTSNSAKGRWLILATATVATGLAAGLGGTVLGLLLHLIQHVAYGYSLHAIVGHESFLEGVSASSPVRRFVVLCVCGAVAGTGWWALYRFGSPLVSIRKAVEARNSRMPFFTTIGHDLLQIVTVGLGSPLGREVAPREIGAMLAGRLCDRAGLAPEFRRLMVACGAGAGLAAVYSAPLGGTLFVLEVLLGTLSLPALIPAFVTCVIATVVAWVGLGNESQYSLTPLAISSPLVVWSVVMGPVFGFAAYWFARGAGAARAHAPRDWRLPLWCAVVFPVIGLLATPFPQLLGNGKSVAQEVFGSNIGLTLAVVLLLLRVLVTLGALRAGAEGGLLTPGLSIGALLGIILGGLWNYASPGVPLAAFAIIGGAAFLASSMKMPLTAVVLIMEFTRAGHDFLIPMLFGVIGSVSVFYLCTQHGLEPTWRAHHDDIPRSRTLSPHRHRLSTGG
jgi:H+/Cl- antiporter ClcA